MGSQIYIWISKHAYKIAKKILSPRRSKLYMPWHKSTFDQERHREMVELRRILNRVIWQDSSVSRKCKLIISGLVWPIRSFGVALFLVANFGQAVKNQYGIGKVIQYFELIWLANRYNIDMDTYYQLCLFLLASWDDAVLYLNRTDGKYLLPGLSNEQEMRETDDKLLFYKNCKEYGLPAAPIYAYFNGATEEWIEASLEDIPWRDLFIKWTDLYCGIGAQLWRYCADDSAWQRNGTSYKLKDLISYCRNRSHLRPLILQPRLINHPQIARFSLGGLCTIRVVTSRLSNQEPEIICAGLKMPDGESMIDNLAAGGLVAGIHLKTGSLSTGQFKDIRRGTWDSHPNTNNPLKNQSVHNWQAIADLCTRAHKSFKKPVSIGWDVIVTPTGPMLLEANANWCFILAQKALGNPIGFTSFPSHYIKAWNLENVEKAS